jgi:FkbM family methyltransferase
MKQAYKEKVKVLYRFIPGKKVLALGIRSILSPKGIDKILRFWGWFSLTVRTSKGEDATLQLFNYCSDIESQIFWYGLEDGWEKDEMKEWMERVKNAATIVDIGANTGVYALLAKAINPQARVYAFEPVDRIFAKLEKNVQRNNLDIKLEKSAISNMTGEAVIYDPMYENVTSVAVNTNLAPEGEEYAAVSIKTITLDDYCKEQGLHSIDLIKIDVESHEPEVLAGYTRLHEHQPVIFCEVWNNDIGLRIEESVVKELYRYYLIDSVHGGLKEMPSIIVPSEVSYCNYLFIPRNGR